MRIHLSWLADFVDVPPVASLPGQLAAAGVEVEAVSDTTEQLADIVVGLVVGVEAHADSKKLHVCQVDDAQGIQQVVCGANNVRVGMHVPFARVGARLPYNVVVAAKKIHGVMSSGMLCSSADCGLTAVSTGLWELPSAAPGTFIGQIVDLPTVMTLGITPNRPDLMSHQGIAREIAALAGKRLKASKWRLTEQGPDVSKLARVHVDEPALCRRLMGRVVQKIVVGPSPKWLTQRLEAIGQRSINNVVDATNYVMHELGQPLHAYDQSRLAIQNNQPTLRVRFAREGEVLTTLDGVERRLVDQDLVVADGLRPVALAGLMGGADSQVSDATTAVVIEAAAFDAAAVRRTSRRHNLRTEASQRFERGSDLAQVSRALERCCQLLVDIAGGEVAKGALEVAGRPEPAAEIPLRIARIGQLLGVALSAEAVVLLLDPLGLRCSARTEQALIFEVPSFRRDISCEIDLIEEVARRYGYENLPERLPATGGEAILAPMMRQPAQLTRRALLAQGVSEVVTFALTDPQILRPFVAQAGEPVMIRNPLGTATSALRTTLLPGLLQAASHNCRHGQRDLKIFEIGEVFRQKTQKEPVAHSTPLSERDAQLPVQHLHVAALVTGERMPGRWFGGGQMVELPDAAGLVETMLEAFDADVKLRWSQSSRAFLSPEMTGVVSVEFNETSRELGCIGQLAPAVAMQWDLSPATFVVELSLTTLAALPIQSTKASPVPRFVGTRRDVAFVADQALSSEALRQFIKNHAGGGLGRDVVDRVTLFDRYAGKPISKGSVSLAFAIFYRSNERTLTDAEVNKAFSDLLTKISAHFEVTLRT